MRELQQVAEQDFGTEPAMVTTTPWLATPTERLPSEHPLSLPGGLALNLNSAADATVQAASERLQNGEISQAIAMLREAIKVNPSHMPGRLRLAAALERQGEDAAAEHELRQAIEIAPPKPAPSMRLSRLFARSGRLEEAIDVLRTALALQPGAAALQAWLAELLARAGRWEEAAMQLRQTVALDPENVRLLSQLCRALSRAGRLHEAIEFARLLVEREPERAAGHAEHGLLLLRMNEVVEAECAFRKAVDLEPRDARLRTLLALAMERRGLVREPIAHAKHSLKLTPESKQVRDLLARLQTEQERRSRDDLMMQFDSLGDNCEFGFAQRAYGAEPLSLLRWCTVPLAGLLKALHARFEGIGEPENVAVKPNARGEYQVNDKAFGLRGHSFALVSRVAAAALQVQECQRLTFLKRKLIEDLEDAKTVFVYKSAANFTEREMVLLFEALQIYGPNTLLCVTRADGAHPSGVIEVLRDGLFKGYISRFADYASVPTTTLAREWHRICSNAIRLHRARLIRLGTLE